MVGGLLRMSVDVPGAGPAQDGWADPGPGEMELGCEN